MTKEDLFKLQKISNINLNNIQENDFLDDLNQIISMIDLLSSFDFKNYSDDSNLFLRLIDDSNDFFEPKKILSNVEHPIINNSIVIKTVV